MDDRTRKPRTSPRLEVPLSSGATKPIEASPGLGKLIAIGGREDRREDMLVLRRFVELCGPQAPVVVVLTAASGIPRQLGKSYQRAFGDLGVGRCDLIDMRSRDQANDPRAAAAILAADGIFMTGGDQSRLLDVIGGTASALALLEAFSRRGACVGGTSAGAAALSLHMLAEGGTPRLPEKNAVRMAVGLGLIPEAIIDQHFSERRRLGRLLSAVAHHPHVLGVGIDEDTALVIDPGRGVEVVGDGAVTIVDGRRMRSNVERAGSSETLEMLGVHMHLLPAGNRYPNTALDPGAGEAHESLAGALRLIAGPA